MGEFILRIVAEAAFQVAGYATGWVVVPLFTLGRVVVEPRKPGGRVHPKWSRLSRAADGTWILDAEMGCLAGLVFWFAAAGIWWLIRRQWT
jgi:hypothetical protein